MSALVMVVRHRTVDLVAMSALRALRHDLGHSASLRTLRREDAFVLEGLSESSLDAWGRRCLEQSNWFNPNKHRYGIFRAAEGTHAALRSDGAWPSPWLLELVDTDRPDLLSTRAQATDWVDHGDDAVTSVTLASWNREVPIKSLPGTDWPGTAQVARLQLWSLGVDHSHPAPATFAEECTVTQSRERGLLVNPHMEGWSRLEGVAG